jgi:hypothetical protein
MANLIYIFFIVLLNCVDRNVFHIRSEIIKLKLSF